MKGDGDKGLCSPSLKGLRSYHVNLGYYVSVIPQSYGHFTDFISPSFLSRTLALESLMEHSPEGIENWHMVNCPLPEPIVTAGGPGTSSKLGSAATEISITVQSLVFPQRIIGDQGLLLRLYENAAYYIKRTTTPITNHQTTTRLGGIFALPGNSSTEPDVVIHLGVLLPACTGVLNEISQVPNGAFSEYNAPMAGGVRPDRVVGVQRNGPDGVRRGQVAFEAKKGAFVTGVKNWLVGQGVYASNDGVPIIWNIQNASATYSSVILKVRQAKAPSLNHLSRHGITASYIHDLAGPALERSVRV